MPPGTRARSRTCTREFAPEGLVVVGHSMSGIALPLVPALAPVRRLIFLAALVPAPGQRMIEVQASEDVLGDTGAVARDQLGRSYWTSIEAAIDILYHDCDAGPARKIAGRLRPQARANAGWTPIRARPTRVIFSWPAQSSARAAPTRPRGHPIPRRSSIGSGFCRGSAALWPCHMAHAGSPTARPAP
jgi:hypothetical protein